MNLSSPTARLISRGPVPGGYEPAPPGKAATHIDHFRAH